MQGPHPPLFLCSQLMQQQAALVAAHSAYLSPMATMAAVQMQHMAAINANGLIATPITPSSGKVQAGLGRAGREGGRLGDLPHGAGGEEDTGTPITPSSGKVQAGLGWAGVQEAAHGSFHMVEVGRGAQGSVGFGRGQGSDSSLPPPLRLQTC